MPRIVSSSPRSKLGALWAAAGTSVIGAAVAVVSPALAAAPTYDIIVPTDTWDPLCTTASVCRTDDATVYYYIDSQDDYMVSSAGLTPIVDAMNAWSNNTDITAVYDDTPVFSGPGETDAVWRQYVYADDTLGVTTCMDRVDGTRSVCDSHYIEITPVGGWISKVTRHEMGHALGLVHGPQASPVQTECATRMAIMRKALSCTDTADLGAVPKNNVDHLY